MYIIVCSRTSVSGVLVRGQHLGDARREVVVSDELELVGHDHHEHNYQRVRSDSRDSRRNCTSEIKCCLNR